MIVNNKNNNKKKITSNIYNFITNQTMVKLKIKWILTSQPY